MNTMEKGHRTRHWGSEGVTKRVEAIMLDLEGRRCEEAIQFFRFQWQEKKKKNIFIFSVFVFNMK